jgi:2,5-diamino-6-(ribosylamino)-4(3H)-pyrimidinone 5'-phosphate reductase
MTVADRPRLVTFNFATLDGRIAYSPSVPSWLDHRWASVSARSTEVDFLALHDTNVSLEGSNSFVPREAGPADLPPAPASNLFDDFLPRAVLEGFDKWMAVADSRGRVSWTQTAREETHIFLLVSRQTPAGYLALLRELEVPYVVAGDGRVDFEFALRRLRDIFGTKTIVSTAGGVLNGTLLRRGLVDEVDLQLMPVVLGRPDAPSVFAGYNADDLTPPAHFTLAHVEPRPDGSVLLRFTRGASPASVSTRERALVE